MTSRDETYERDLAADDRFYRRRSAAIARNPDCSDPDHPGCEHCAEEEEQDD